MVVVGQPSRLAPGWKGRAGLVAAMVAVDVAGTALHIVAMPVFIIAGFKDHRFTVNQLLRSDIAAEVDLGGQPGGTISARLGFALQYAGQPWARMAQGVCALLTTVQRSLGSPVGNHCITAAAAGPEAGYQIWRWSRVPTPLISYGVRRMTAGMSTADVAKWTIWAEGRSGGYDLMAAIGSSILNRVAQPGWWGRDIASVCLARNQFSCWITGSSQRAKIGVMPRAETPDAEALAIAADISALMVAGSLGDTVDGADSYYAETMAPPSWTRGRKPTATVEGTRFYRVGVAGTLKDAG